MIVHCILVTIIVILKINGICDLSHKKCSLGMNKWQANARQAYRRETESQAVQNKFKPEKKLNYNRYMADG